MSGIKYRSSRTHIFLFTILKCLSVALTDSADSQSKQRKDIL